MKKTVLDFLKNEEGASALEYGVMIAALAAVIISVVIEVGNKTNNTFQKMGDEMGKLK